MCVCAQHTLTRLSQSLTVYKVVVHFVNFHMGNEINNEINLNNCRRQSIYCQRGSATHQLMTRFHIYMFLHRFS